MRQSFAAIRRALRAAAAAALVAVTAACADGIMNPIGFTVQEPAAAEPQSGTVRAWRYSLPKGVFFASLYEVGRDDDGVEIAFLVRIEGPVYVPDPDQTHTLTLAEAPASGVAPDVRFYDGTPFLRVISFGGPPSVLDADGGSAAIGGEPNDADAPGRQVAGPIPFDILSETDRARVAAELEETVRDYARRVQSSSDCAHPLYTKPAIYIEARIILDDLEHAATFGASYVSISVDALAPPRLPDTVTLASATSPEAVFVATTDARDQAPAAATGATLPIAPSPEPTSPDPPSPDIVAAPSAPAPAVVPEAAHAPAPRMPLDGRVRGRCAAGFCYRPMHRYNVTLRMGPTLPGGPLSDPWLTTFDIALPNESPIVVAPIEVERLSSTRARILFDTPGAPSAVIAAGRSGAERRAFDPTASHLAGPRIDDRATSRPADPSAPPLAHDLVYPRSVERARATERSAE